ncbi:MAG: fumarylacetoacetate hydrolase family protein [Ginsengibacter sp.]
MTIFCIEQNYLTNKRERDQTMSSLPSVFVKPPTALVSDIGSYPYSGFADNRLFVQSELVLRISESGKEIPEAEADQYFDAITTGLNFTQVNIQDALNKLVVPWEKAKGWPGSSVSGNWFPVESLDDLNEMSFCLYSNREMMQLGNSELMIYNFQKIVSLVSKTYSLQKGDLIFTGTPIGIGEVFSGDTLESFLEDETTVEFQITS